MNRFSYYLVLAKHTNKKVKVPPPPHWERQLSAVEAFETTQECILERKQKLTEKERIREENEDKLFPFLL